MLVGDEESDKNEVFRLRKKPRKKEKKTTNVVGNAEVQLRFSEEHDEEMVENILKQNFAEKNHEIGCDDDQSEVGGGGMIVTA